MTLPRSLLRAIGQAVQDADGDRDDVDELVKVWRRLDVDLELRAARMRYDAEHVRCCCADGDDPDGDSRCSRCYGQLEAER